VRFLCHASLGISLLALCSTMPVHAAAPTLTSLFPAGGQKGSRFTLTTTGSSDATTRCWTDAPGVSIQPDGKPSQWKASLSTDTPSGLYQVRLFNREGASDVRWLSVGRLPEVAEKEPNDETGKGQVLEKLPVCVNARLDKAGDVDGYRVTLKKGQTLVARVEAYALGSPVDVMAHVLNENGNRVVTASDARNLDPFFTFAAPEDGIYTVQLAGFSHPPQANVAFTGGNTVVYRLQISDGPVVTHMHPAAVSTHAKTETTLQGCNLDPAKTIHVIEPAAIRIHQGLAWVDAPDAFAPLQAVPVTGVAAVEKEPNNQAAEAMPVKADSVIGGCVSENQDQDRFSIDLKKGQRLQARIFAKSLGSPLDATLQILAPDGKSVTLIDDIGVEFDPSAQWTADADGIYQIAVSDTLRQGSGGHNYLLEISSPAPRCEITLPDAKALSLAPGKSISIKAAVKRLHGLNTHLVLRAANVPPGVHADEVAVPEKDGEVELKLVAAANAATSQQPIQIAVWTKSDPATYYTATAPLRGETLRGTSLLDTTSDIWLTVTR